ncbi:MAG: M28 family peptidase [Clostridia bacterium]
MREDIKKYADSAYGMVSDVSESIGSRLPGSEGEKKFATLMEENIKKVGLEPTTEKFIVAPRASIGGIPYIGWAGIVACLMLYFEQLSFLSFAICVACWVFLVVQVVLYKGWFDHLFPQKMSQNVYTELLPKDGKYNYTIMLSAHMDTSWNWVMSATNPKTMVLKMVYGVVGMLFTTAASLTMFIMWVMNLNGAFVYPVDINNYQYFLIAMKILPALMIPGIYFVTRWCVKNEGIASPGAMDNLTGIAINYEILKYFKENPDKMPANCRIMNMNFGCEEAGLKGSIAFLKKHKGEDILKNLYAINVDSIADKDFFEVVVGDTWQGTRFDKGLEQMFMESMKDAGIEKPGNIKNPVGGCDSTPLHRAGVRTITFAAQNPMATEYYHTYKDTADRFEASTVQTGMEVILGVIDRISSENK